MTATDHGITVTIKYGKSYDDTWAVFKAPSAESVRADIVAYFGIEYASVSELSLHELVQNVTGISHGTSTAATMLGAIAIPAQSTPPVETGNPWAGLDDDDNKQEETTDHPYQYVLDAIAAATDVKELQKVWASNQPAFKDDIVTTAYKARGKELQK